MDENIQDVEDIYDTNEATEPVASEKSNLGAKIAGGLLTLGIAAAGKKIYDNRENIKGFFAERKAKKQAKEVKKHLDALAKLDYKGEVPSVETKTE